MLHAAIHHRLSYLPDVTHSHHEMRNAPEPNEHHYRWNLVQPAEILIERRISIHQAHLLIKHGNRGKALDLT